LIYEGEETVFELTVKVVSDPENNEFLALDYAREQLDAMFKPYVGFGAPKVAEGFEVPEVFSAEDALFEVEVSYDQVTDYQPYPIKFAYIEEEVEEGSAEEPAKTLNLIYTKPNDDATVRIEIYIKTANVDEVIRYNVTAAGYTKEEIIEYLKESSFPAAVEGQYSTTGAHVTLASGDTTGKFAATNLTIAWASNDEEVLTSAGKFKDPYLSEVKQVKLTATVDYKGTVGPEFAFTEVVEFDFQVNPAANKAQAIALELSGYLETEEFLAQISHFPFGKVDRLDAEGKISNVLPLPTKISEVTTEAMADYQDLAITWSCSGEGTMDENHKLLKQYLRYHEVVLTYTVTVEGIQASGEVVINVGITEVKNTIYLGGNWYQQSGTGSVSGDVLSMLSKFDSPVGVLGGAAKTWGYSYSYGQFQGTTWYIDVKDDAGNVTRYQYFAHAAGFHTLDDMYKIELSDPADSSTAVITINEELNKYVGTNYGGNWAAIYHNVTDHDIKVPMAPLSANAFLGNAEVQWENHPWKRGNVIDRDNAFSMDGWRIGFVMDKDGKVVIGSGADAQFQAHYDADGDGQLTEADYWVTIPAGGYAYTPRTQQNAGDATATYMRHFCQVGAEVKVSYFDPYYLSPDGTSEGIGSWKHE
jgi:hypothetical protein